MIKSENLQGFSDFFEYKKTKSIEKQRGFGEYMISKKKLEKN